MNVTSLKYSCRSCAPGYYGPKRGTSRGLVVAYLIHCLRCPFRATCIGNNIAAKPNFWGYPTSTHPRSLEFLDFRKITVLQLQQHITTLARRTGSAPSGYNVQKVSLKLLFSTECRNSTECGNYFVWIVTMVLTITLVLYLLIKPPLLIILRNQVFWFINSKQNQEEYN